MRKSFTWSLCHFILIAGLLALFVIPVSPAEALGSILFVSNWVRDGLFPEQSLFTLGCHG